MVAMTGSKFVDQRDADELENRRAAGAYTSRSAPTTPSGAVTSAVGRAYLKATALSRRTCLLNLDQCRALRRAWDLGMVM